MLDPIDTEAVIKDGGAVGHFPGEIHEGVPWWMGACFVVVCALRHVAVGHDAHPTSQEFGRRFCNGAVNARHFGCTVSMLGSVSQETLLSFAGLVQPMASAYLSTEVSDTGSPIVRIRLYDAVGHLLQEDTGLADIRLMITEDNVPIPVSDSAKGTVLPVDSAAQGTTE